MKSLSSEALQLYASCDPIDLHVESFVWTRLAGYDLCRRHGHGLLGARLYSQVDFPRIREARIAGATWVISTNPWRTASGRVAAFDDNLTRLTGLLGSQADFEVVTNYGEYRAARARGAHAAFIGIQGGNALDLNLDALDRLDGGRVLRITLVHMSSSRIGVTSSPLRLPPGDAGLTPFGKDYVQRLDEKRVFVDLAHISRQGFWDAVEVHDPSLPLIVTHTGVCGVHPHWRNLDDDQVRAIADSGGTIGIIYHSEYLGDGLFGGRVSTVVDHIAHVVNLVGDDHVSLGSDWDGMICTPRDMPTCLELPILVQHMLNRGWSDTRIGKILSGNFLRTLQQLRG